LAKSSCKESYQDINLDEKVDLYEGGSLKTDVCRFSRVQNVDQIFQSRQMFAIDLCFDVPFHHLE
jgi:hypothetical protein